MKFECSAQELYTGLVNATRALAAKPVNTVLEGVSLTCSPDLGLELLCSDGNMSISAQVGAVVYEGGNVILPGRLFTEIVRKMPDGTIKFTLNEKMVMNVRSLSGRANLSGTDADFPVMEDLSEETPIHLPREALCKMISKVAYCMGTDENRAMLIGTRFELSRTELRLIALDGFRMGVQMLEGNYVLPDGVESIEVTIPAKTVNEMQHIMESSTESMVTLRFSSTHVMMNIGSVSLVSSLLAMKFIDYKKTIPTTWLTRITVDRRQMMDAADRAALMAREGKLNLIRIESGQDEIKVTSNSNIGDTEESLEATVEGEEIFIAFNARYIIEVLRSIEEDNVVFCMNTNVSPCVVSNLEQKGFLYLILPVRVYK